MQDMEKLRKRKGITQKEFCKKLDISESTYSQWKNGTAQPSIGEVERIASCLGKEIRYFVVSHESFKKGNRTIPSFRKRLFEFMTVNGLTEQEVADLIGFSRGAVAHWKTGYSVPDVETAQYVAEQLGLKNYYLV